MVYLLASLFSLTVACKSVKNTTVTPHDTATVAVKKDPVKKDPETSQSKKRIYDKQLNIAVMMPFYLDREYEDAGGQTAQIASLCLDYYQGLLLAADSLRNMGINMNIFVYDTKKDTLLMKRTLLRPELKTMNLIIGPLFREQINLVSEFSRMNKIPMLFPFSSASSNRALNPYVIQANADHRTRAEFLAAYLKENYKYANVVIIRDYKNTDKEFAPVLEKYLDSLTDFTIRSTQFIKGPDADYESLLSADTPNVVVISSVEETTVNGALAMLKNSESELHVYGLQNWLDFKTNYYNLWEQMHINILSNFYIDAADRNVIGFRRLYRKKYFTEPTEYAYRGFDQLLFLGKSMLESGPLFTETIVKKKDPALHTTFNFILTRTGEIENKYMQILQFRDFQLIRRDR